MPNKEIYHIISNTHWDREWYQSHEKYLVRLIELFDRLTEILEKNPGYRFITDGQYALVDDYVAARPEMKERLSALVKKGQLLTGPWYTQPLENIVGGEALIRNLQYGIQKSEELGGAMRFSYEIDEFGHASQMPQIYDGFDIHSAMAWRGIPKKSKPLIKWTSPDGTSVNMLYSRAGYGHATTLPLSEDDFTETIDGVTFKRRGLKNRVNALREHSLFNAVGSNMFWLNGIDHSWAQSDLLEVIDKIRELFPDIEVKQSTPTEYADAVIADHKELGIEPAQVKGELIYTAEDILESTNALHPRQKKLHYASEKHYTDRFEPLAAAAWLLGSKYPSWALRRGWQYILENHAHDSLGCCSVDEVFEQVCARYNAAISLSEQEESDALRYIMSCSSDEPSVFVFNLSSYKTKGTKEFVLDIPAGVCDGFFRLTAPDGSDIPFCVLEKSLIGDVRYNPRRGHPAWLRQYRVKLLAELPEIPSMGWIKLNFENTPDEKRIDNRHYYALEKRPGVIENEFFEISFNPDGTFNVFDKQTKRVYPSQLIFEDVGECADVYVHSEPTGDRSRIYSGSPKSISCIYDTPLGAAYELTFVMDIPDGLNAERTKRSDIRKPLTVKATVSLLKGDRKIGIGLEIENKSRFHRLRVLFPSNLKNAVNSAGGQAFDHAVRAIRSDFDPELPREQDYATKPFIDYCCVSEDGAGLGVAAKGIYEYECTDDEAHSLALTLLRCVEDINTETFADTPEYKCREAQNIGSISYELSLIPYCGDTAELLKEVTAFCDPVITLYNRKPEDSVLPEYIKPEPVIAEKGSFLEVSGGAFVTCFKKTLSRDTLTVRLLNNSDDAKNVKVSLTAPSVRVSAVYEMTLEEKRTAKLGDSNSVEFTLAPHKLKTLEFVTE